VLELWGKNYYEVKLRCCGCDAMSFCLAIINAAGRESSINDFVVTVPNEFCHILANFGSYRQ